MPYSAGPNIAARPNLVFEYDLGDVQNSYKGEPTTNLLTYSSAFNGGPWQEYCGNTSNVTYNTTDVIAPDGSTTALKVVRNNVTSCGASTTWGLLYSAGGTLVSGNTYTTSIWARCASGTVSMVFGLSDYYTTTVTLTTTWQRFTYTWNYTAPGQTDRVFEFLSTAQDITYYVWGAQTEQKDHATQYIASGASQGVRSSTQGLLDVSGYGNILDLSTTSYDSNAQLVFDGTDDKIIGSKVVLPTSNNSPITLEAVAKTNNASGWQTVLGTSLSLRQIGFLNNNFYFGGNGGGGNLFLSGGSITAGQLCHIVMVYDGTTGYGYKNGVLTNSGNIGSNGNNNGVPLISTYTTGGGGEFLNGSIPVARVYNSALSAQEVLRNYNQLKGRFNLI